MSTTARSHGSSSAAALILAILWSCGGSDPSPAGRYTLDYDSFVSEAIRVMQDSGRIPDGAEQLAGAMLRKIVFELELTADGRFQADMSVPAATGFQRATYEGQWRQRGDLITLLQTHENGEEKSDTMNGTVRADALHLSHMEEGMEMRYVMRREAGTPASPR